MKSCSIQCLDTHSTIICSSDSLTILSRDISRQHLQPRPPPRSLPIECHWCRWRPLLFASTLTSTTKPTRIYWRTRSWIFSGKDSVYHTKAGSVDLSHVFCLDSVGIIHLPSFFSPAVFLSILCERAQMQRKQPLALQRRSPNSAAKKCSSRSQVLGLQSSLVRTCTPRKSFTPAPLLVHLLSILVSGWISRFVNLGNTED